MGYTMKRSYALIPILLLMIASIWATYKAISPSGLSFPDAVLTTALVLLVNYMAYREGEEYGKAFLALSLFYVGYFFPVFLGFIAEHSGYWSYVLKLDYAVLKTMLSQFHILPYLTPKGIVFSNGSEKALYTYSCSSIRALTIALPLLVCRCGAKRKALASLIGLLLGMPIPWIRLYLMMLLAQQGLDIALLHYTVSPLVVIIMGTIIMEIQFKLCPDLLRKMLISTEFILKKLSLDPSELRPLLERSGGIETDLRG